jgi:hypothetical protein
MNDDKIDNLDLDRRLTDLFGGSSLDLVPRPGATGSVLGRVKRARRRRRVIQVVGPAMAAACVIGTVLVTQGNLGLAAPVPPAGTSTATTPSVTVAPDGSELEMTGTSVGALRLGMTAAEAEGTGLLDRSSRSTDEEKPSCTRYSGSNKGVVRAAIGSRGVAEIQVYPFIHTPQGVAVGDRYQDLRAAYPAAVPATPDGRDRYLVPVPGTTESWFAVRLESPSDGDRAPTGLTRISELSLTNDDRSCG